jgi:hypothetical protein
MPGGRFIDDRIHMVGREIAIPESKPPRIGTDLRDLMVLDGAAQTTHAELWPRCETPD